MRRKMLFSTPNECKFTALKFFLNDLKFSHREPLSKEVYQVELPQQNTEYLKLYLDDLNQQGVLYHAKV